MRSGEDLPTRVATPPTRAPRRRVTPAMLATLLLLVVLVASWVSVMLETAARDNPVFSAETWEHGKKFLGRLAGLDEETPAFFKLSAWANALKLAYETLAMSVLAIGISTAGMLLTVMLGARPKADVSFVFGRNPLAWPVFLVVRASYIISRAVPELFWAMLIILVFKPGILAAALALAIHDFGVLSRLCAEVVEDIDGRPIRSLRASGASGSQTLLYGVLPTVLPQFLTYILYRWEIIIRATIVVGFVAASGLGREFKLRMSYFHYSDVALLLIIYFLLVVLVDLVSAWARRMSK